MKYIIETDSSSGAVRKVYDIRQVHDPNNLKVAAINRRDGVIEWQPVSLFPVKDYHVYEMMYIGSNAIFRIIEFKGYKVIEFLEL